MLGVGLAFRLGQYFALPYSSARFVLGVEIFIGGGFDLSLRRFALCDGVRNTPSEPKETLCASLRQFSGKKRFPSRGAITA